MTTAALLPLEQHESPWPAADTVVLRNRPLRVGTDPAMLSRFGDPVWHIKPAHPDAHLNIAALIWARYPNTFQLPFKTFFLAALDHPYPGDPAVQRGGERAGVATFRYWFMDLEIFAKWLDDHGITRLCDVTAQDLDAYRAHVLGLSRKEGRKIDMLAAVRTLWLYGPHLPEEGRLSTGYPWPGASDDDPKRPAEGRENKTPRIAPETMTALLAWALHVVESVGPDVRDAWVTHQQINAGVHPSQAEYRGPTFDRVLQYIERCRRTGESLPGLRQKDGTVTVNCNAIKRMIRTPELKVRVGITPSQKRMLSDSGLPIAQDTYVGQIAGMIDGRPWRETPITLTELRTLVRMVAAACFVVICYLSGARPGEVLNLRPGCREVDEETGELLMVGRRGKGFDRASLLPEEVTEDQRPWVVVAPVHAAIALLESLGDYPFLFPASFTNAHAARPNEFNARQGWSINNDLEDLLAWVNATFRRPGEALPIPPDPTKHLHASRFRRTLAYFIVRRPRGLVAAALQYAHVHTKVTLSYAGRSDTTWMDDIHIETLELVLEQNEQDARLLNEGEHVSGPSADEYRHRVRARARFAGRVVTAGKSVERLLDQANPNIHHGEGMTCVWRRETAACRQARLEAGLPAEDGPDESECRSACTNLAYTDRSIVEQRLRLKRWEVTAADRLAPRPLRDRAAALAAGSRAIIDAHGHTTDSNNQTREH
ncbi:integrase [Kitasatospora sp. NBC_00039]|uniref:integrase n=1 Tax=Kitasatospora sp. NBC_00039 TaxID=2903565 RepID=UPI00324C33C5